MYDPIEERAEELVNNYGPDAVYLVPWGWQYHSLSEAVREKAWKWLLKNLEVRDGELYLKDNEETKRVTQNLGKKPKKL